ncbi:von willebrand factor type a domain containing protein [Niveomyces insectorum RCEF 264]|uniref:von willebrand factor type a domain containing protein n=1 Tax=Niveomyces insectorum RCEF 264 TaxID=1081102 RepID=A0A167P5P1_9HYPO|nr:von willebrand factor type a domain containing protein [Niveomyces insectorum RCEF 264]
MRPLTPQQVLHVHTPPSEPGDDGHAALAIQPKHPASPVGLTIHRLPTDDGVIIKATPPTEPDGGVVTVPASTPADGTTASGGGGAKTKHVPCDIVLVIDVSGSMGVDAPVPAVEGEAAEENGFSVLDLVKHAARTILETLDTGDRIGLVQFATAASVLQPLQAVTPETKQRVDASIEAMRPLESTNLWQGLLTGIGLFKNQTETEAGARVPAIMVLTDGMPNFMNPPQGYIPKMRTLGPLPAPIHTFGFGYQLRSGLLKSISEFSGGNYAFIPDAGMIGTVFVHAVANMQSTFATSATLRLTYSKSLSFEETMGAVVGQTKPVGMEGRDARLQYVTIRVGNIQYGQSRDIYVRYTGDAAANGATLLRASLRYHEVATKGVKFVVTWHPLDGKPSIKAPRSPDLSAGEIAFHVSRAKLCSFLAGVFPLAADDEHVHGQFSDRLGRDLDDMLLRLPAAAQEHAGDPACAALLADITGQVKMALTNASHFSRWGRHYLPSLQCAHATQQCNSFKDPGPLLYGASSPLFIACRDALDAAFDTLPPPKPSNVHPVENNGPPPPYTYRTRLRHGAGSSGPGAPPTGSLRVSSSRMVSMSAYRNSTGPCFASFCRVALADGRRIRVNRLRRGMRVLTPRGPRAVAAILKTPVSSAPMVAIGRLLITAWHPVSHNGADWLFPCHDPAAQKNTAVRYTGAIYSVLLQHDGDVDAHALSIEGTWVVTLGHGLTAHGEDGEQEAEAGAEDVRVHPVFGDYAGVCRRLASLDIRKDGLVVNDRPTRSNRRLWRAKEEK